MFQIQIADGSDEIEGAEYADGAVFPRISESGTEGFFFIFGRNGRKVKLFIDECCRFFRRESFWVR